MIENVDNTEWYENAIKYYQNLMRNTRKLSERTKCLAKIVKFKKLVRKEK